MKQSDKHNNGEDTEKYSEDFTTEEFDQKEKVDWLSFKKPFVWVGLLFASILIGISVYYIWLFFGPVSKEYTTNSESTTVQEILVKDLKELAPNTEEYSLSKLQELANVKNVTNWFQILKIISKDSAYIVNDLDENNWKVAIGQEHLSKVLDIIRKSEVKKYKLIVAEHPLTKKYLVDQMLAQLKKQGYLASSQKVGNKLRIQVANFKSQESALESGEKIYEFFRKPEIFPATFTAVKMEQSVNALDGANNIFISLANFNYLTDTYDFYSKVKYDFKDYLVYITSEHGVYNIKIGFFKDQDMAESMLGVMASDLPNATIGQAQNINFK